MEPKKKPKGPKPRIASKRIPSSKASTSTTENLSKPIRTDRPLALPDHVRAALQRLSDAGHVAYVVGGSVRDFLLRRESKDHDVATSATPDQICEIFPDSLTVGKAFGVLKVPVRSLTHGKSAKANPSGAEPAGEVLEIATFREDLEYVDHRHPKRVRFAGIREDARRRDFTVNALYYDPKTAQILDPVNGNVDLTEGVIRAIGDADERFREDALRLLRAVRFTSQLDFRLDPVTAAAIANRAKLILKVSPERVRDELGLMLAGPQPAEAFELLGSLGLLRHLLPELEALHGVAKSPLNYLEEDLWSHTLKTLRTLAKQNPKRARALGWATLLLNIGKPVVALLSGGKNYNNHEAEAARLGLLILNRLKLSNADSDKVILLLEEHLKFREVFQMRESTLLRFIRQPHFEDLLALHRADATATDGNLAYYEFARSRWEQIRNQPGSASLRLIDGTDLIQLGFAPGKEFSEILRAVEDLTLEKKLNTKEEALEYVVRVFVK